MCLVFQSLVSESERCGRQSGVMADAESLWLSYSDPNEDILSVGCWKEHSLCIQCETLNFIFFFDVILEMHLVPFLWDTSQETRKTLHMNLPHRRRVASSHK